MRTIGLTAVVLLGVAVPPAPAVDHPGLKVDVPGVVEIELGPPAVELPARPAVELPRLPVVESPALPGEPLQPPVGAPRVPDVTLPETSAPVPPPSSPGARGSQGRGSRPPAAGPAQSGKGSRPARPRRDVGRRAERRTVAPQASGAPRSRPGGAQRTSPAVRPAQPAASPGTAKRRSPAGRIPDDIADVVEAMPAAVLWALFGTAAIGLGLAGNALWQSRQRAALRAQRAELLGDIGLLSGALLPPVPDTVEGLALSAAYRPADGPAAGGDFYDLFELGDRRVGVVLGDVSGHGRDSVAQAALARYTLRTVLADGHGPGEALARADRLLQRDLPPHFVTVVAAVYDDRTGELTYAKAGHAAPIVLGTEHHPEAETSAPPIGMGLDESWPEFRLEMTEGVSVCLFTDGLEDARVAGARLGRDAVTRLLAAHDVPDAGRLLGDVADVADHVCDDTAAVVLRRR